MQKEFNAVIIILLFLLTTVQCESFRYHSHSDEAERKFSAIEREGLFHGQMSLLDWVSVVSSKFWLLQNLLLAGNILFSHKNL